MLRHKGDGLFEAATAVDREKCLKVPAGRAVWFELKPLRSERQNRYFHALLQHGFLNQPGTQWRSLDHLKSTAFCAVGYCDAISLDSVADANAPAMLTALFSNFASRGINPMLHKEGDKIEIRIPKSWAKAGDEERRELIDKVIVWLCGEFGPLKGTDPDSLNAAALEGS